MKYEIKLQKSKDKVMKSKCQMQIAASSGGGKQGASQW